jgi:hypothetical protein
LASGIYPNWPTKTGWQPPLGFQLSQYEVVKAVPFETETYQFPALVMPMRSALLLKRRGDIFLQYRIVLALRFKSDSAG